MTKINLVVCKTFLFALLCLQLQFGIASTENSAFTIDSQGISEEIKVYVGNLLNKSSEILKDKGKTEEQKKTEVIALLKVNLDLEWMSSFVLGRQKNYAEANDLQEFKNIYSEYLPFFYSKAVRLYNGQDVVVYSVTQSNESEFLVKTRIVNKESGFTMKVDYMVRKKENEGFRVFDVLTENISLLLSQKREYASFLENKSIKDLVANLKEKISK